MLRFPVKGRTLAELKRIAEPMPTPGGTSEALAHIIYDTDTYVDATTTQLTFFTTTRANRQLSNLSPAGALPEPQYFEIYSFMVDIFIPASTTTGWYDYQALLFGSGAEGAPTFTFTYANKVWGPWPLSALHGTGGITGFGLGPAAAAVEEYANNSVPDGGMWQDGAICLAPNQAFQADINWSAAVDISANKLIRVAMGGVLHRRVL